MLNKNILLPFFILITHLLSAQTILSYVDSTEVKNGNIWGGISWNGSAINITTMSAGQIHFRQFDTGLNDLGTDVQLTFSTDYQGTNIADHKHIYLNGNLYITFMTSGNQELYLLKTDSAGNRIKIVTLETLNNGAYLTNDMHFATDSTFLYVIYPKITSGFATTKRVRKYNLDLDSISTYEAISPIAIANLGGTFYKDSMFYMFAGNEDQHHLLVARWDTDWTVQTNFYDTLIKSSNAEWNYFATGIAYDTVNSLWYIAYHVMLPNALPDHETIWLAVFDKNFDLLEKQQVTTEQHFRPHLLLHENYLYMVYDGSGVMIKKFKVDASSVSQILRNTSISNDVKIFPNPFSSELTIQSKGSSIVRVKLYNQVGACVSEYKISETKIVDLSYLTDGLYYFMVTTGENTKASKLIKGND